MIYHVYANQSNIGDWLSARGIQSLLPDQRVNDLLCDEPFVAETLSTLSSATEEDFVVIGGGGLFMDYFNPFWEGFLDASSRVPFCIWGAGYCDMKREESRPNATVIREVVRRSKLCVVRDELTRGYLSDTRVPPPVICPTVVAVATRAAHKNYVLHVDHLDNAGDDVYEMMVSVTEKFADRTGRPYRQTNNIIPAGQAGRMEKLLDLYADAELVVTSRLHGCIIGLATGRPVLAVSGDRKVESFMNAAGLGEWVCDINDMKSFPAKLDALSAQRIPFDFVEAGRRANRAVGEKVSALAVAAANQSTAR
jgi:polysaccharide pyruvyl transferase WcaK-like protein